MAVVTMTQTDRGSKRKSLYKLGDILDILDHAMSSQSLGRRLSTQEIKNYEMRPPKGATGRRKGDRVVKHDDLVAWLRIDGDLWSDSLRLIGEDPLPAPPDEGR